MAIFLAPAATFDLDTYTPPSGWSRETKNGSFVSYTTTNPQNDSYCRITVMQSTAGRGGLKADFESEWQALIVKQYGTTAPPQTTEPTTDAGWQAMGGVAPFKFNGGESLVMLTTMSGYNRAVSIVVGTNSQDYQPAIENFLSTVVLAKPETIPPGASVKADSTAGISGTWAKSAGAPQFLGDPVAYGNSGYSKDQYTFKADGTYTFVSKTFRSADSDILLVRENGSYQIDGDRLAVTPQRSVIEAWSKKDGTDKFGKLLSTRDRLLEKTTYRFTKHYFSGLGEWNLVLQADSPTQRDGPFSNNKTFGNAWYYSPGSTTHPVIDLPEAPAGSNQEPAHPPVVKPAKSGYQFTTTNFDDGWIGTEQEDWVHLRKDAAVVLIHYAVPDIRNFCNLDESTAFVWNTLVAPRYKDKANLWIRRSWWEDGGPMDGKYFAQSDLTSLETGQRVHVALIKNGNHGKWIEFITPDKTTFERLFTPVQEQGGTNWDKLSVMGDYNKFAMAPGDLPGNWHSASGAGVEYFNVYTGNSAGMAFASSNTEITFQKDGTYKSVYKGVDNTLNGTGNRYHGVTYQGNYLAANWELKLTNRFKGVTDTFAAHFEAVKGGRILHLFRGTIEELHLFRMKG